MKIIGDILDIGLSILLIVVGGLSLLGVFLPNVTQENRAHVRKHGWGWLFLGLGGLGTDVVELVDVSKPLSILIWVISILLLGLSVWILFFKHNKFEP